MSVTRNRKSLFGSAVVITTNLFMLSVYVSLDRIPLPIYLSYLVLFCIGGTAIILGVVEQNNARTAEGRNSVREAH